MWPFSHLAIGYLLYSGYTHIRLHRSPNELAAVFILLGTQLPDLIDKPLAWIGVLSGGRSLGHSLLFALPVIGLVGVVVHKKRGEIQSTVAFGIAYIVSVFLDGIEQFFQGTLTRDIKEVSFWFWPLTVPAERIVELLKRIPTAEYVITHKAAWTANNLPAGQELKTLLRLFELGVTVIALAVWIYDGVPGWRIFRESVARIRDKTESVVR